MFPACATKTRPAATKPTPHALPRPDIPGQPVESVKGQQERQPEYDRECAGKAHASRPSAEQPEIAPMRVEAVEAPHERIVGVERGILLMEQDRQAVSLVALTTSIAPDGQEDDRGTAERRSSLDECRNAVGSTVSAMRDTPVRDRHGRGGSLAGARQIRSTPVRRSATLLIAPQLAELPLQLLDRPRLGREDPRCQSGRDRRARG